MISSSLLFLLILFLFRCSFVGFSFLRFCCYSLSGHLSCFHGFHSCLYFVLLFCQHVSKYLILIMNYLSNRSEELPFVRYLRVSWIAIFIDKLNSESAKSEEVSRVFLYLLHDTSYFQLITTHLKHINIWICNTMLLIYTSTS